MVVRRSAGGTVADDDIMKNAKNALFVLVIATAAIWLGEALLGIDVSGGDDNPGTSGIVPEAHADHTCASGFSPVDPSDTDDHVCSGTVSQTRCGDVGGGYSANNDGTGTGLCLYNAADTGSSDDSGNGGNGVVDTPAVTEEAGGTTNDEGERILAELRGIRGSTQEVSGSIVSVFKYILLVATLGAVIVLRTGSARNLKVSLEDGPAVRPANA